MVGPSPEPLPQPGQVVRWQHPRLACALGRFSMFGPGPFEIVAIGRGRGQHALVTYLVRTPEGPREIDAAWLGLAATTCGETTSVAPNASPAPPTVVKTS
jgi:hypothetical protein